MNPSPKEMAVLMISSQLNHQQLNDIKSLELAKQSALLEIQTAMNAIRFLVSSYEKLYQYNVELNLIWSAQVEYWKAVKYRIETEY